MKNRLLTGSLAGLLLAVGCESTAPEGAERTRASSQAVSAPSDVDPSSGVVPKPPKDTKCDDGCGKDGEGRGPGQGPTTLPPDSPAPSTPGDDGIHGGSTPPPPGDTPPGDPGDTKGNDPAGSAGDTNGGDGKGGGGAGGSGDGTADRPNKPNKPGKGKDAGVGDRPCMLGGSTISYDDETQCIDVSQWCILDEDSLWRESCFMEERGNPMSAVSNCMYTCYRSDGSTTVEVSVEPCTPTEFDKKGNPTSWKPNCGDTLKNSHW